MKYFLSLLFIMIFVSFTCKKELNTKTLYTINPTKASREIESVNLNENQSGRIKTSNKKNRGKRKNIASIKVEVKCSRKKPNKYYWDAGSKPDLFGMIEFPSREVIAFPLKPNSFTNTAYGKNLTLNKGDTIKVYLYDKDISEAEVVAEGKFVYNGKKFFKKRIGLANFTFSVKKRRTR